MENIMRIQATGLAGCAAWIGVSHFLGEAPRCERVCCFLSCPEETALAWTVLTTVAWTLFSVLLMYSASRRKTSHATAALATLYFVSIACAAWGAQLYYSKENARPAHVAGVTELVLWTAFALLMLPWAGVPLYIVVLLRLVQIWVFHRDFF